MAKKTSKTRRYRRRNKHRSNRSKTAKGLFSCWGKNTGASKSPSPLIESPLIESPIIDLSPGSKNKHRFDAANFYALGQSQQNRKEQLTTRLRQIEQQYRDTQARHSEASRKSKPDKEEISTLVNTLQHIRNYKKALIREIKKIRKLQNINYTMSQKINRLISPKKKSTRKAINNEIEEIQELINKL